MKLKILAASLLAASTILGATSAASQTEWRIGATLASYHIDATQDFNEFNPGLFVSVTFQSDSDFQYGLQAGAYLNSYSDTTRYGLAFANLKVMDFDQTELRVGAFVGMFEYANLAEDARDLGWPTIGNYLLALGPSLTLSFENGVDVTFGYLPINSKAAKGVITLQTSISF